MSLLFYWKENNYISDMATEKSYHLNQDSELIKNLHLGQHVWAFTRIKGVYVLAADLYVLNIQYNPPCYKYGAYRANGDKRQTRYFDVYQLKDAEPLIRKIFPQAPSFTKTGRPFSLGSFFQGRNGVRELSLSGQQQISVFSNSLRTI